MASVERKSLSDLVSSLTGGQLRFALAELATLPRAAVVVEDRFSQVFALRRIRPAMVADGLTGARIKNHRTEGRSFTNFPPIRAPSPPRLYRPPRHHDRMADLLVVLGIVVFVALMLGLIWALDRV